MLYFLVANIFANKLWISWLQYFRNARTLEGHFPPLSLLRARDYFPGISRVRKNRNAKAKVERIQMQTLFQSICIDA